MLPLKTAGFLVGCNMEDARGDLDLSLQAASRLYSSQCKRREGYRQLSCSRVVTQATLAKDKAKEGAKEVPRWVPTRVPRWVPRWVPRGVSTR